MAITDNDPAFVDASAVSIGLSQMFTVTPGATDPTYLVLTVLDRNEYTAGASDATQPNGPRATGRPPTIRPPVSTRTTTALTAGSAS